MIVIADASPLNYLILIGEINLLPKLYGSVVVPTQVLEELRHQWAPSAVVTFARSLPNWVRIENAQAIPAQEDLFVLDKGEQAAIALALEHEHPFLLMDEEKGRRAAKRRQIPTIGILGILATAAERDLVDLPVAVKRLQKTNFHVAPKLLGRLLEEDAKRRRQTGG